MRRERRDDADGKDAEVGEEGGGGEVRVVVVQCATFILWCLYAPPYSFSLSFYWISGLREGKLGGGGWEDIKR